MKRSLSLLLALSSWGLLATLGMAQQEQQQGAVIVWEVPYEELISGRPIKLQVPPIQEDTVLYVLRVRVPEKLSLQQLEQLRKNWAHEVRKEISAMRTHQDTFVVQSYPPKYATIYGAPQDTLSVDYYAGGFFLYQAPKDTFGVQGYPPKYVVVYDIDEVRGEKAVIYYIDRAPQDTAGVQGVYPGGYFLYSLPQDTTQPARLAGWVGRRDPVILGLPQDTTVPTPPPLPARITIKPLADRVVVEPAPAEERQIAYNAGVEGAIIVERRGNVLVVGNFTPTHVALPMPELELDPGDGPVCGIPGPLGQGEETVGSTARYTGYVLNQAIAPGPRPLSGKTLGAVTRQAPPQGGNQNMGQAIRQQLEDLGAEVEVHRMAGPISLPRPSDVGIPEFRMVEGGMLVLWPNGNPPRDPDWPWVGVIGTPVLEGIDGAPGPGKPQNWCGTEYIWTGPRPKSPKELILTPVIPRRSVVPLSVPLRDELIRPR
jgi:hypothetical protein